jgi:hypothetical protein
MMRGSTGAVLKAGVPSLHDETEAWRGVLFDGGPVVGGMEPAAGRKDCISHYLKSSCHLFRAWEGLVLYVSGTFLFLERVASVGR